MADKPISCFTQYGARVLRKRYLDMGWEPSEVREGGHGWCFDVTPKEEVNYGLPD